jgi:hypothetical protein
LGKTGVLLGKANKGRAHAQETAMGSARDVRALSDAEATVVDALRVKGRVYRWQPGQQGAAQMSRYYHQARQLAKQAAPDAMRELIDLALFADGERVRSVCVVAVLDRAGVRPKDFDPLVDDRPSVPFNPRDYSPEDLAVIEKGVTVDVGQAAAGDHSATAIGCRGMGFADGAAAG